MSEFAITGNEACLPRAEAADETFQMDEERFRAFYERTSRQLWGYLSRVSGDPSAADDLMQEAYYRLLSARLPQMGEAQLKSYLYRIASNLLTDDCRREKHAPWDRGRSAGNATAQNEPEADQSQVPAPGAVEQVERRTELALVFKRLNARERELLWLAYAEGSSHKEIAEIRGIRPDSVRQLLFRTRHKLAELLRGKKTPRRHKGHQVHEDNTS